MNTFNAEERARALASTIAGWRDYDRSSSRHAHGPGLTEHDCIVRALAAAYEAGVAAGKQSERERAHNARMGSKS